MDNAQASFAVNSSNTKGRKFPQNPHRYRDDFQRDRDRIIHSESFRRLEGKTQVFTPGTNDNYRNRLTHSIEVAQIARTIAKNLGVNETLTEAISLGHDIGHSPFGHEGERVLNELTADIGGFEHNRQALRLVDIIENPYPQFRGLNLLYETRLGLAKHSSPYDISSQTGFAEKNCSIEGQIADIADRIAYNCHDLEDGLRENTITEKQMAKIAIFARVQEKIAKIITENSYIRRTRTAKAVIDELVSDCIETSRTLISKSNPQTIEDIYKSPGPLVNISAAADKELLELEKFLLENMYKSATILNANKQIEKNLNALFKTICEKPDLMPYYYQQLANEFGVKSGVCDYIAGMTDRYCMNMVEKYCK